MKTIGALIWEPGTRSGWTVEEIELDPPKSREVRIKLAASGICHSDDHVDTGDIPLNWAPIIGGHEGAGIIEEVGPDVTGFEVGDHVVLSFMPSCGNCEMCTVGKSNMCVMGAGILGGTAPDGTHRVHLTDGVGPFSYLGTFSPYVVVHIDSCVKIDKDIPLKKAALIGCGVPTGWGSAVYAAEVELGETVVVIGTGGVGMNAVQGARHKGAKNIVAIDPVEWKRDQAKYFGATHTRRAWRRPPSSSSRSPTARARRGDDHRGRRRRADPQPRAGDGAPRRHAGVHLGRAGHPARRAVRPVHVRDVRQAPAGHAVRVDHRASRHPADRRHVPPRRVKLDELITKTYKLEQINQAFKDMREGRNIRGVIMYDE